MRPLFSSVSQRPCGIAPPLATVAATRAIWNGDATTSPCPYADCDSAFFNSAAVSGDDAAIPSSVAVSCSASAPTSYVPNCAKYALQLTTSPCSRSSVPCGVLILHVVANRPLRALQEVPTRPSGSRSH